MAPAWGVQPEPWGGQVCRGPISHPLTRLGALGARDPLQIQPKGWEWEAVPGCGKSTERLGQHVSQECKAALRVSQASSDIGRQLQREAAIDSCPGQLCRAACPRGFSLRQLASSLCPGVEGLVPGLERAPSLQDTEGDLVCNAGPFSSLFLRTRLTGAERSMTSTCPASSSTSTMVTSWVGHRAVPRTWPSLFVAPLHNAAGLAGHGEGGADSGNAWRVCPRLVQVMWFWYHL